MRLIVVVSAVLALAAPAAAQERPGIGAREAHISDPGVLASLVAELEQRNPELAAARREVDTRVARIAPAGAPPDPTVSVGFMNGLRQLPFFVSAGTPDAWRRVGFTQEVPYPGKLALRSKVAASEADAVRWSYEDTRVRLVSDLKAAYIDYVCIARVLDVVRRNKAAFEQYRDIAEVRFAVGKASQQDVLRAQLEVSLLLERIASLERDREVTLAEINRLLNRPAMTPVPVVEPLAIAPGGGMEALQALAVERYPAIERDEQLINRGQQALALAKREQLPDFEVNVMAQKYAGGMPWMYGVDFMVKVPIFWQRKQRPMVAEAAAALEGAERVREHTRSEAEARVAQEHAVLATSRRLMDLYGDSVLPQARLALESATAAYEVGSVDFLTLLTNFITVLNYEVGYEEQHARYRLALARLEPLVGAEYVR